MNESTQGISSQERSAAYGGGCAELSLAVGNAAPKCCWSCHWDDYEGYADLIEVEHAGKRYAVCCCVANNYDDKEPSNG